jgi:hypothetical protein
MMPDTHNLVGLIGNVYVRRGLSPLDRLFYVNDWVRKHFERTAKAPSALTGGSVTWNGRLNLRKDTQPQFATLEFHPSRWKLFDGFRFFRLDRRQIFSDLVDCARHPSRYHIVCIGIEVRFHETKYA